MLRQCCCVNTTFGWQLLFRCQDFIHFLTAVIFVMIWKSVHCKNTQSIKKKKLLGFSNWNGQNTKERRGKFIWKVQIRQDCIQRILIFQKVNILVLTTLMVWNVYAGTTCRWLSYLFFYACLQMFIFWIKISAIKEEMNFLIVWQVILFVNLFVFKGAVLM